jgi:glycosyltransferase involved in cell wall biosynthesis
MKICFIADARSPIAENWIQYFVARGHDINIISTYPCTGARYPTASIHVVSSKVNRRVQPNHSNKASGVVPAWIAKIRTGRLANLAFALQHQLECLTISDRTKVIQRLLKQMQPDLVHAMRLPFEGIMAAQSDPQAPLLVSIWGNDLTLFARRFGWINRESHLALRAVDAVHCDCERDLKLAGQIGFDLQKPSIVLPGGGGIQLDMFAGYVTEDVTIRRRFNIGEYAPLVCNPRGFRAYVRSDTFFRCVSLTAQKRPDIVFAAVGMRNHPVAERWVAKLGLQQSVRLLPTLSRDEMAMLLRTSDVMVSPSEHDGTPNTLLESMAAGAFPVVGDIESVREWITDGINGSLRSPTDPDQFAEAILSVIDDTALRYSAAEINLGLIEERAEYTSCMKKAEDFYLRLIRKPELKLASSF